MQAISTILLAILLLAALGMIGLILVQHGKGADMGAAFGSGSSGSLFGASGSANFLSRSTAVLAVVFFTCTLLLAYFSNARPAADGGGSSVLERVGVPAPASSVPAPAVSAPAPAGAAQIPGGGTAVPAAQGPATTPATTLPVAPASGAAQIPTK